MLESNDIPIWEKPTLTLTEAAQYTGIGINRLRDMSNEEDCDFVVFVGNRRLLKRRKLEAFIDAQFSL
ncbi:MAG: excisionase [Eggerthellaceae bacterium]|nr:excisionase [Eggerthellaceae bacterium]